MGAKSLSRQSTSNFKLSVSAGSVVRVPDEVKLWMLAGGGGGGGSGYGGGGGGAGGLVDSLFPIAPGKTYVVTVGAGGAENTNGGDSIFEAQGSVNLVPRLISYGGGAGNGSSGGCGGGGPGGSNGAGTFSAGVGKVNQGNDGGDSNTVYNSNRAGGGGGGLGASGTSNALTYSTGAPGGAGTTAYNLLMTLVSEGFVYGSDRYIGSGGSGSCSKGNGYLAEVPGVYGSGSGARTTNYIIQNGGSATAFTGSGGGGGGVSPNYAGAGASGFVIVYYSNSFPQATTTGSPTYYSDDSYHYYKFKTSGTISF